ncbi:hypothetical protein MSPP1_003802 [Malassezia sp. CBS 17886]|nr:hypothetical protein MSPP1_003802 [Malassezia sp. CBS 17886]
MSPPVTGKPHTEVGASAVAGACAGFVSSMVTCPLDVIKTRLQAETLSFGMQRPVNGFRAVTHLISRIWHDDGVRGFYRGLGPTMIGYLPTWAIYFGVYDTCKQHMIGHYGSEGDTFATHVLSAMTAGAVSTSCTSPLWVVKTRCMLQTRSVPEDVRYRNTLHAIIKIYHQEGIGGFYKGLLPSLLGVSHVAIQFPLYEYFKRIARACNAARGSPAEKHEQRGSPTPGMILLCSGGSKMLASVATYPHEVMRTRLQMMPQGHTRSQYTGLWQAVCRTWSNEGIRGFYRGMGVNLVRTVPNSGLTILTYELIMHYFVTHPRAASLV